MCRLRTQRDAYLKDEDLRQRFKVASLLASFSLRFKLNGNRSRRNTLKKITMISRMSSWLSQSYRSRIQLSLLFSSHRLINWDLSWITFRSVIKGKVWKVSVTLTCLKISPWLWRTIENMPIFVSPSPFRNGSATIVWIGRINCFFLVEVAAMGEPQRNADLRSNENSIMFSLELTHILSFLL